MPLESQRHVDAREVARALELPDNFCARDERLGVTWGLGPALEHRDSGYMVKANSEALLKHLRSDPTLDKDWYVLRASHWGFGWCEQIVFRVLDQPAPELVVYENRIEALKEALELMRDSSSDTADIRKEIQDLEIAAEKAVQRPSRILKVLLEYQDLMQEFPVADEELMDKYRREAMEDYIVNCHIRGLRGGLPDDWEKELMTELDAQNEFQDEPSGDLFVSPDALDAAITKLGFKEVDNEEDHTAGN